MAVREPQNTWDCLKRPMFWMFTRRSQRWCFVALDSTGLRVTHCRALMDFAAPDRMVASILQLLVKIEEDMYWTDANLC